jgi:hypothetical protein
VPHTAVVHEQQDTLAQGFTPPKNVPTTLDILPIAVGTDPGLALGTRKGTGYYKAPSLKGVWYRAITCMMGPPRVWKRCFDPERLKEDHVPGGWLPPGTETRAIKGHEFVRKSDTAAAFYEVVEAEAKVVRMNANEHE